MPVGQGTGREETEAVSTMNNLRNFSVKRTKRRKQVREGTEDDLFSQKAGI